MITESNEILPRYPVYIPSKGRWGNMLTANCLTEDGVDFYLVVEKEEVEYYTESLSKISDLHGNATGTILTLPFSNQGSVIPARNWIKEHSTISGFERHWQIDDNIHRFRRVYRYKRIQCSAGIGLRVCEDFTDRYENIAVSGLTYEFFVIPSGKTGYPPFFLNCHVYSTSLILNSLPHKWRFKYNEDTDYCLQVLSDGWCTVALNAFMANKCQTTVMTGGNTPNYKEDGRLKMSKDLERVWPYVVRTSRKFNRPQHHVRGNWKGFDQPLIRKPDIDWKELDGNVYDMKLVQVRDEVKSDLLKGFLADEGQ